MNSISTRLPALNYKDYTLLIVDDNPINLGVLAEYVEDLGFETMVAQDGRSALEKALHSPPDLILLDVMMPELDGFETCRRLTANEITQDIPIIFMTALTNVEEKIKGFEAGAVDYITKPFHQEEVLARIVTHLRLRSLTKQLAKANQELTILNISKDKFFSIVAHDLRGPFNPLLGMTELLTLTAETAPRSDIIELSQGVHRSARNVFILLENLLDWSRLQLDRVKYDPEAFDLKETIKKSLKCLVEVAFNKMITLNNVVAEEIVVYADKYMLNTVIRNLVSNAIKFTSPGGQITISARIENREDGGYISSSSSATTPYVEVTISDTGVGISEEDLAKLFRFDLHHTTVGTANESGTGLGLIICQEMTQKNGGRIWAESSLGQGTIMRFTVPLFSGDGPTELKSIE